MTDRVSHPPRPATHGIPFAVVLGLFLVSGASGLIYEVLWTRRLTLLFGSGLFATSTVLATFMGGLALGAWLLGRVADRRRSPLAMYGWLEIGLGLYALAVPFLISSAIPLYQSAYRAWNGAALPVNLTRLVLATALFLLPTVLMGGTLPALSRFVVRGGTTLADTGVGGRVGRLYAVNTWGAVGGCLLAGFVLIELLGMRRVELVTIAANVVVGACAVLLGRRVVPGQDAAPTASAAAADPGAARATDGRTARRLVLVAIAVSGFAALGYEVIWTRYLSFFLGNSTYAFSGMLAMFLLGLAVGAVVAAPRVDRLADPFAVFAWVEALVGFSMVVGILVYARLPEICAVLLELIPGDSRLQRVGARVGVAFFVLFVPTFFLGTTFPLAGRLYVASLDRVATHVGGLYAANTFGAILGSLSAGFVLIPWLGFRNAVVLLVCVNAALALALSMKSRSRAVMLRGFSVLVGAVAVFVLPREVFLATIKNKYPDEEIVYYRENPSATVFVTRSADDERWVHFSDERGSGGTVNLPGHRFWGHLPSLLAARRDSAAVICFGSGITLGSIGTHPYKRIVCAEICEKIDGPARWFPENHGVLDDPRVQLVTDDGRNVLLGTGETFDVIVSEPPLLETAGVVNLFTRDFYRVVRSRLTPGGVFCQWVPSGEFNAEQHGMIVRTFLEVFPDATFWGSPLYYDTMLIGTNGPGRLDFEEIARRIDEPEVRRDLEEAGVFGPLDVLSYFGLSPEGLRRHQGSGRIMTDDRTVLDFEMPRTAQRPLSPSEATFWKRKLRMPPGLLEMEGEESVAPRVDWPAEDAAAWLARLGAVEHAKDLVLAGHRAGLTGDTQAQSRLYDEAAAASSELSAAAYYAAVNRIERAEAAAARGESDRAGILAESARVLAGRYPHLARRLEALDKTLPTRERRGS